MTEQFKSKQQKPFMSFKTVTALLILQTFFQLPPRSDFISIMSPLAIILLANLSAKSIYKPNE